MDNPVATLIDSPLTPYSSEEKINAWLKELGKMPDTPEVRKEKQKALQQLNQLAQTDYKPF